MGAKGETQGTFPTMGQAVIRKRFDVLLLRATKEVSVRTKEAVDAS